MTVDIKALEQAVLERFPEGVQPEGEVSRAPVFRVCAIKLVELCGFLKSSPEMRFDYLLSLTAVDWPERFEAVYHLYSVVFKGYITLKVNVDKSAPVLPSVTPVWRAADWQEREVYDMFGIEFAGHPDLRRILMEEDWEGFPLRKDYVEE